jgi:uncharacterized protein (DUF952 family)
MRETFHLVPLEVWAMVNASERYVAESLATEGFIHCTDGVRALGDTFDRHYASDQRPFVALTLDLDALDVGWRYDDPGSPYPHIYGPIVQTAIVAANPVERDAGGRFAAISGGRA